MLKISDFLNKFRTAIKDSGHLKEEVSNIIREVSGVSLEKDSISFNSKGSLVIKCSPIEKSEIFLKKSLIVEEINKKTGRKLSEILF